MTNAKSILSFIEAGSQELADQIENLKRDSPVKRAPPARKANIKTLSSIPRLSVGNVGGGAASIAKK